MQGGDAQLTFLVKNFQALSFKYALHSPAFQESGIDLDGAIPYHDEVKRARDAIALCKAGALWVPVKGDNVLVRLRLADSSGWVASNLSLAWSPAVVRKVRMRNGDAFVDLKVRFRWVRIDGCWCLLTLRLSGCSCPRAKS